MPLPGRTLSAQLVWPVVGLVLIAVLVLRPGGLAAGAR